MTWYLHVPLQFSFVRVEQSHNYGIHVCMSGPYDVLVCPEEMNTLHVVQGCTVFFQFMSIP